MQFPASSVSTKNHGISFSQKLVFAKVDRYLASWKALLLSTASRVVLINAVLGGLPTYAMVLPPGVIKTLDARRRAFLWTGTDMASGVQCLIA